MVVAGCECGGSAGAECVGMRRTGCDRSLGVLSGREQLFLKPPLRIQQAATVEAQGQVTRALVNAEQ